MDNTTKILSSSFVDYKSNDFDYSIQDLISLDTLKSLNSNNDENIEAAIICNCLKYIGDNGRIYNFVGVDQGCVKVVWSKDGTVIAGTAEIFINKGFPVNVEVLEGQDMGFLCC